MEIIEEEIVNKRTVTKYKAIDGTTFDDEQECLKYEGTALCVVRARLNITETTDWELFYGDDAPVEIVRGKAEDTELYVRLCNWCNTDNMEKSISKWKENIGMKEDLQNVTSLIFKNNDGEVYTITRYSQLLAKIENIVNPKQEE